MTRFMTPYIAIAAITLAVSGVSFDAEACDEKTGTHAHNSNVQTQGQTWAAKKLVLSGVKKSGQQTASVGKKPNSGG